MGKQTHKPLNAKKIANAKHDGKGYTTLPDRDGLELRVMGSGTKSWVFRYTSPVSGKRRAPTFAKYGESGDRLSLAEARLKAAGFRQEVQAGRDPFDQPPARQAKAKVPRVEEDAGGGDFTADLRLFENALTAFEKYLLTRRDSADNAKDSIRAIKKDVLPSCRGLRVEDIGRGILLECVDTVYARGSKRMAGRLLADLKQMFGWLELRERIMSNPLRDVKARDIVGRQTERDRVLDTSEVIALLEKLPSSGLVDKAQLALLLIFGTACRVGEILISRWDYVDFDRRLLTLPKTITKNGIEHVVHLSDFSLKCLRILYRETGCTDWFFPSPRKEGFPIQRRWLTQQINDRQRFSGKRQKKKTAKSQALELSRGKWTPHDVRRTVSTTMASLGVLPEVIERCLNHVDADQMKRIYQRYNYEPEKRRAWDAMGKQLEEWLSATEKGGLDLLTRLEARPQDEAA